jgi:hypothetical protein
MPAAGSKSACLWLLTIGPLGEDSGPTADRLADNAPLSYSLRRVPTTASRNRLNSESTVMATVTLIS